MRIDAPTVRPEPTTLDTALVELREARAELARIQSLPELEWAQVSASLMLRLSALARSGNAADAQSLVSILDRGKTYVGRLKADREALKAACEGVVSWWLRDGIRGSKVTDMLASNCRSVLASMKEE